MRRIGSKAIFFWLIVLISGLRVAAQDLTGIWRGYFITELRDHYKFEVQMKQTGNSITGVSYSYLNTVFYGKATLTGSFNKGSQSALIKEIRTVEVRMAGGSQACIMRCIFNYSTSGKEEFLEGTFTSRFEQDGLMNRKGDDCGGGKVYLRRVTTSDFYIEPFLRNKPRTKPVIDNQAPPIKKDSAKVKPPVVINKPPVTKPVTPPLPEPPSPKKDTSFKKVLPEPEKKPNIENRPITPPPPVIRDRQNELVKVLTVSSPDVVVRLYDNGEIDGDTISVYLDNKLVLSSKRLTAAPLTVSFKMDEDNSTHELTMVAENLGTIPPNTSLMIVEAGEQRFEVRITSTEQKNAVVRFRYSKPG